MDEQKAVKTLKDIVIRFSGDSGDGMQLTGTIFSDLSAMTGNTISTLPDFPAEIRPTGYPEWCIWISSPDRLSLGAYSR